MKAIVLKSADLNDFEKMEVDIPDINDDELLLRVKAIGLGVHDGYFFPEKISYPYVIGIEASGVVEKTGKNIKDYQVGDRIAVVSMMQSKGGVWAEYAAITKDSLIVKMPKNMSFNNAAGVLVAGNTVLKALSALKLKKDDRLFVAGGSGAIGSLAIQLAHEQGVIVSASASKENSNYMKSLGAKYTVDYNDPFWINVINDHRPEGQDAVMAIPRNTSLESMKVLRNGGKIISISNDQIDAQNRVEIIKIPYNLNVKEELDYLMDNIATGKIHLEIEHVYKFDEAITALASKSKQHARGKSIITLEE